MVIPVYGPVFSFATVLATSICVLVCCIGVVSIFAAGVHSIFTSKSMTFLVIVLQATLVN